MKHLKDYQGFFEGDGGGCAMANASNTTGMGSVVSAQVGALPGVAGTSGSGDVGFGLLSNPRRKRRKKGKPNQVSDLRDLKEEETKNVSEDYKFNQEVFDLATKSVELYHWLCEDKVDKKKLDSEIIKITNNKGWYILDTNRLNKLVNFLENYKLN